MSSRALQNLHPDITGRRLRLALRVAALTALTIVLAQPDLPERAWLSPGAERLALDLARDPEVVAALVAQNRRLAAAPEAWTNAAEAAWAREAEQGGGPFLNAILRDRVSRRLQAAVAGSPVAETALLVDAAGRTLAATVALPSYRFALEPGWAAVGALPPGGVRTGPRGQGHDGTFEACWLTRAIHDADGRLAGAVSLELDASRVGRTLCR